MTQPILAVENLQKIFYAKRRFFFLKAKTAPYTAVCNLSFHLNEGEILGILGTNGAGKTTTIEMLVGLLKPTSGRIFYFGKDFFTHRSEVLQQITHASAYHKLPSSLTIQENLEIMGKLYNMKPSEAKRQIDALLVQFGMQEQRYKQTGSLSAGQMTRVMLIKAFLPNPKILLLDEPTASLDPDIAREVRTFISKQQKERKISIILTSHNMQEVAEICDRALVLQNGKILEEDTPEKLAGSVSPAKVFLTLKTGHSKSVEIAKENSFHYILANDQIQIELEESKVAHLLQELAKAAVEYTSIEIVKPTLEDYFLTLKDIPKIKYQEYLG